MTTWINEEELKESFAEVLDDVYEPWIFGGCEYMPSDILKEIDPVHYEIALQDHADYLAEEDRVFCKGYTNPEEFPENE
mgnify:CR=1 FL=1